MDTKTGDWKAERSVPLSRVPSAASGAARRGRLALPVAHMRIKASHAWHSGCSITPPPYVVGYGRRLRSETRAPKQATGIAGQPARSDSIRPNPGETDRRRRRSYGKCDCCEHDRVKASHARHKGHAISPPPYVGGYASSAQSERIRPNPSESNWMKPRINPDERGWDYLYRCASMCICGFPIHGKTKRGAVTFGWLLKEGAGRSISHKTGRTPWRPGVKWPAAGFGPSQHFR